MRTFRDCESWIGTWVAGFTGVTTGRHRNDLVYLMRVGWAFASHRDLWHCPEIPATAKAAKAAHLRCLGDVFSPKDRAGDPHRPSSYQPPISGHSHKQNKAWHNDIHYSVRGGRSAALLVGDPKYAFIWDRPVIHCRKRLSRGQARWTLGSLLAQLEE